MALRELDRAAGQPPADPITARKQDELRLWDFARYLCADGARPTLIESLTNLPLAPLRELWAHFHGARPTKGPLPERARAQLPNTRHAAHASIFLESFATIAGYHADEAETIDLGVLISAHIAYRAVLPAQEQYLTSPVCWLILRDIRQERLSVIYCTGCQTRYVHDLQQDALRCCPHCAPMGASRGYGPAGGPKLVAQ